MDQLLELGRISRPPLKPEEIDLAALAGPIVRGLGSQQPDRAVAFTAPESIAVKADSNLAKLLLQKLLDNAWKFTEARPDGAVELGSFEKDRNTIYYIRDNGAGFDMNHKDHLFKPFQRLHRTDEFAGNGIGLAIAKRIVERHGGRIWAEGKTGAGATFYFTLTQPIVNLTD
jgi:signal transduction histidine kinase